MIVQIYVCMHNVKQTLNKITVYLVRYPRNYYFYYFPQTLLFYSISDLNFITGNPANFSMLTKITNWFFICLKSSRSSMC